MAKYETGDIATYYFVVMEDDGKNRIIGWTDKKELVKAYLEFHKCEKFKLKEVTKTIDEIGYILEENVHDEIKLLNIRVKDPDHKKGKEETKFILIPETEFSSIFISSEEQTFLASRINYSYINSAVPYLKDKYQKALNDIFLLDIIDAAINNKDTKIGRKMLFDELLILVRNFPDRFGL